MSCYRILNNLTIHGVVIRCLRDKQYVVDISKDFSDHVVHCIKYIVCFADELVTDYFY